MDLSKDKSVACISPPVRKKKDLGCTYSWKAPVFFWINIFKRNEKFFLFNLIYKLDFFLIGNKRKRNAHKKKLNAFNINRNKEKFLIFCFFSLMRGNENGKKQKKTFIFFSRFEDNKWFKFFTKSKKSQQKFIGINL